MYILRNSSVGVGGNGLAGVTCLVIKVVLTLRGILPPVDFLAVCFDCLMGGGVGTLGGAEVESEGS